MTNCTCTIKDKGINKQCPVHGTIEQKNDLEILSESYKTDFTLLSVMENTLLKQGERILQLEKEKESLLTENKHLNELLEMYIPTFRYKY